MQTREGVLARLKQLGIVTCRRVGPYLVLGGVATNLYILMAPEQVLETQTCENAREQLTDDASLLAILNAVLVADTGIFVFNVVGAARAVVIPVTHWAYERLAELLPSMPTISHYRIKSLEIFETEVIKAISTGMFISMLPLNRAMTLPFLPISLLPLGRIWLKHQLHDYPGPATYQRYKEIYPDRPWLSKSLAMMESISTGVNLGGSLSALSYFLVNTFYDATHEQDWSQQNMLVNMVAAFGMVAGMTHIFHANMQGLSNHVSNTLEMFYLICMPLLSITMCFAPQLENMDTFMQESIYVVLGIAAVSLLMAEMHTRLTDELEVSELSVEEVDANDSDDEYITVPVPSVPVVSVNYGTFFQRTVNREAHSVSDGYDQARSTSSSDETEYSTEYSAARSSSTPSSSPRGGV